ncbi:MAG: hypothetical protein Q9226_005983 [Calogaya cf. arnoldii]
MKVEKPNKRARAHKVKQGAPPKVSLTQRRKLIRLYLFTNLSWENISSLVLHFGRKDVKKRALQYILQGLLGADYNQMRPKDVAARRTREFQIQRCKRPGSVQAHRHEGDEIASTSPTLGLPSLEDRVDYREKIDRADHTQKLVSSLPMGPLIPTKTREESKTHLGDIHKYTDADGPPWHPDWDVSLPSMLQSDYTSVAPGAGFYIPIYSLEPYLPCSAPEAYVPILPSPDFLLDPLITDRLFQISQSSHQPLATDSSEITASLATRCQTVRRNDVSVVVDSLSVCSSREQSFLKDTLGRDSRSTMSLKSTKSSSTRTSLTRPFGIFSDPPELPSSSIESILSNGIFWYHMARDLDLSCLSSLDGRRLHRYVEIGDSSWWHNDQRRHIQQIWSEYGIPRWMDRFGNTSLHIAAAHGVTYSSLKALIDDVNVNALNTAQQTFMHVLNPKSMSLQDMFSLRRHLQSEGFWFYYRDVEGRTFLDSFKKRGIDPLIVARCWLRPIIAQMDEMDLVEEKRNSELILNYEYVKKLFYECGGNDEQWARLRWAESPLASSFGYQRQHSTLILKKLFEGHLKTTHILNLSDCEGRNLLHITAGDISEVSMAIGEQQQCLNTLRVDLVKHLLDVGVDVNRHDDWGVTPLMAHLRVIPYHHVTIENLLGCGADPNARDSKGKTALHIAVKLGNIEATRALLARGANVHVRNKKYEGVVVVGERAQRHSKNNLGLYAKITACMALVIDAGAIAHPTTFLEWDTPGQYADGDDGRPLILRYDE